MSIEKPSMVKKSSIVAIIWVVISTLCRNAIAYLGRMVFGSPAFARRNAANGVYHLRTQTVPSVCCRNFACPQLSRRQCPPPDSQLLVASSSFSSDIYKPVIKERKRQRAFVGRKNSCFGGFRCCILYRKQQRQRRPGDYGHG